MRNRSSILQPSDPEGVVIDGLHLALQVDWFALLNLSHVCFQRNNEDGSHVGSLFFHFRSAVLVEVLKVLDLS